MKLTRRVPKKDGSQFVCCWVYDGKIWSDVFRVIDGIHWRYDSEDDEFKLEQYTLPWKDGLITNLHFVLLK